MISGTLFPWALIGLATAFVLLGVGYAFGSHDGQAKGEARGLAEAPLLLRDTVLASGKCPLCGAVYGIAIDRHIDGDVAEVSDPSTEGDHLQDELSHDAGESSQD